MSDVSIYLGQRNGHALFGDERLCSLEAVNSRYWRYDFVDRAEIYLEESDLRRVTCLSCMSSWLMMRARSSP